MMTATGRRGHLVKNEFIFYLRMSQLLFLQNTKNLVISRCCFAEDGKEMYQDSKRTCTVIALLIKPFCLVSLSSPSPSWFAKTPYCSVRDWTRCLRHRIKKYPNSPVHTLTDSLRIYIFSTLESVFIFWRIPCRIRRIRVNGSRIRNEKVADSKISVYVWTGP